MDYQGSTPVMASPSTGIGSISGTCMGFFGHAKVNKQNIVKNPPTQPSQLGKDGWYSDVQNCEGKL